MLYADIGQLIREKVPQSAGAFLRRHGFSAREVRTLLQKGGVLQIRDSMVQRLCVALRCMPNDLFRWKGEAGGHLHLLNVTRHGSGSELLASLKQADLDAVLGVAQQWAAEHPAVSNEGDGRLFLNVARVVEQRQQWHTKVYLVEQGFSWMEVSKLFDPKRKAVRVSMLSRLCESFGCLPNDLYDWEGSTEHALNALRKGKPFDLKEYLAGLSLAEARRLVAELIRKGG